jgi:hypothetical protein
MFFSSALATAPTAGTITRAAQALRDDEAAGQTVYGSSRRRQRIEIGLENQFLPARRKDCCSALTNANLND